jgi:iron-sulfur cluster repair protein YtfE (RIC family)
MRPLSRQSGDSINLDTIAELLQAAFDAHITNVDDALELLQLTEYIQAEIHARHGDELQALLLGRHDVYGSANDLPF